MSINLEVILDNFFSLHFWETFAGKAFAAAADVSYWQISCRQAGHIEKIVKHEVVKIWQLTEKKVTFLINEKFKKKVPYLSTSSFIFQKGLSSCEKYAEWYPI